VHFGQTDPQSHGRECAGNHWYSGGGWAHCGVLRRTVPCCSIMAGMEAATACGDTVVACTITGGGIMALGTRLHASMGTGTEAAAARIGCCLVAGDVAVACCVGMGTTLPSDVTPYPGSPNGMGALSLLKLSC
jgi:hypothetical protein